MYQHDFVRFVRVELVLTAERGALIVAVFWQWPLALAFITC